MRILNRRKRASVTCALAVAGALTLAGASHIPQAYAADAQLKGDSWDDIAKLPDWTGTWLVTAVPSPVVSGAPLSVAPDYAKKFADAKAKAKASGKVDNGLNECEPNGMPTMMNEKGMQYQFLFTPGRLTVVPEDNQVRRIYTNRDKHIADPDLTYGGESIGHWEGKTFVIDTIGLLPHLPIVDGFAGAGDQHVVERISLKDANTMQIATTVNDSALSKPYSYTLVLTRHRDMPMVEKLCVPKGYGP
jgi:hypothetical protein